MPPPEKGARGAEENGSRIAAAVCTKQKPVEDRPGLRVWIELERSELARLGVCVVAALLVVQFARAWSNSQGAECSAVAPRCGAMADGGDGVKDAERLARGVPSVSGPNEREVGESSQRDRRERLLATRRCYL